MKNLAWAVALKFLFFIVIILLFAYISYGHELEQYKFPNDYRGIIHLHSELSHDSDGKFEDIIEAAKNNEVDFIVLTDHWSPELYEQSRSGLSGATLIIAGTEISKNEGVTIIAFPLPRDFVPEKDWKKNVVSLREKGSLALASHIEFSQTDQLVSFDGIEITNLHAHILQQNKIGLLFTYFRALVPWNWNLAYIFTNVPNLKRWHYLNQERPVPAFGGNDTHDNYKLFYLIGPKLGSYDNTFKLITTHIWANELSEKSIKESVKIGQSYFAFEVFGRSTGFRFYATDGFTAFLPGSNVLAKENIILAVQAPAHKNSQKTQIKILKDGKKIKEGFGMLLNLENPKPGNYYAEIWKDGKPWIFSNSIRIQ